MAIIAAAKVGGILAKATYPADFMEINLAIALNTIRAAYKAGVKRLLYLVFIPAWLRSQYPRALF